MLSAPKFSVGMVSRPTDFTLATCGRVLGLGLGLGLRLRIELWAGVAEVPLDALLRYPRMLSWGTLGCSLGVPSDALLGTEAPPGLTLALTLLLAESHHLAISSIGDGDIAPASVRIVLGVHLICVAGSHRVGVGGVG